MRRALMMGVVRCRWGSRWASPPIASKWRTVDPIDRSPRLRLPGARQAVILDELAFSRIKANCISRVESRQNEPNSVSPRRPTGPRSPIRKARAGESSFSSAKPCRFLRPFPTDMLVTRVRIAIKMVVDYWARPLVMNRPSS